MSDSDLLTVAILLLAVLLAFMTPPGPGTPLHERVK